MRMPEVEPSVEIPKIIYQTFGTKHLPAPLADNVEYIKNLNPSWEHVLFDDQDIVSFIRSEYGTEILELYFRINEKYGAARADLFRYLVIYRFGGVYLDIKSRMLKSLDDIIKPSDKFLLSRWGDIDISEHGELRHIPGGEFENWHVIGIKGHPFLRHVANAVFDNIESYRPWRQGVGKNAVLRVTGPVAYTLAIYPLVDQYPNRRENSHHELFLQYTNPPDLSRIDSHQDVYVTHYTKLEESLITLNGFGRILSIPYFLRIHLLLRVLKHLVKG